MSAQLHEGQLVDRDAVEIGGLYEKARTSLVDSVKHQIECGLRLNAKKEELGHGAWLPWLKTNAHVLGFKTDRTAQMLMKAAKGVEDNPKLTSDLDEVQAAQISRKVWGNDRAHVANNSGENEWYTPQQFIVAAREVMGGIDLDPASCALANETVQAEAFYTAEDNGISQDWYGNVWLNPPYAQPLIAQFAAAVVSKRKKYDAACVLVNNATDTEWLQSMLEICDAACFVRGRIKFMDKRGQPSGAPLQGQVVLYFGDAADRFCNVFSSFGWVCGARKNS